MEYDRVLHVKKNENAILTGCMIVLYNNSTNIKDYIGEGLEYPFDNGIATCMLQTPHKRE
jgi:hypothetical protein